MPLNRRNTREFVRVLKAGTNLQRLILYKRGEDQRQGVVTAHVLFSCYREQITRAGQTLRGPLSVDTRTTWHVPRAELTRAGVAYLTATDKLYDPVDGVWWTPYADDTITESLQGNVVGVQCKRTEGG